MAIGVYCPWEPCGTWKENWRMNGAFLAPAETEPTNPRLDSGFKNWKEGNHYHRSVHWDFCSQFGGVWSHVWMIRDNLGSTAERKKQKGYSWEQVPKQVLINTIGTVKHDKLWKWRLLTSGLMQFCGSNLSKRQTALLKMCCNSERRNTPSMAVVEPWDDQRQDICFLLIMWSVFLWSLLMSLRWHWAYPTKLLRYKFFPAWTAIHQKYVWFCILKPGIHVCQNLCENGTGWCFVTIDGVGLWHSSVAHNGVGLHYSNLATNHDKQLLKYPWTVWAIQCNLDHKYLWINGSSIEDSFVKESQTTDIFG